MPFSESRELYPVPEPYKTGMMDVSHGHSLYYEVSGKPGGQPVVFIHGGPGSGTSPKQRCFFDPSHYQIILMDQRGAGRSTPFASLEANTTWDLVADLEALRALLGLERWMVWGGSWGSTLALAYAQSHPERVTHLVLRGIFLLRKEEIDFFYQGPGTNFVFPDAWEHYLAPIPEAERGDLVRAYHRRLTSEDAAVRAEACRAWSIWEGSTSKLYPDAALQEQFGGPMAESLARIECHYFVNGGFMDATNFILHPDRIARIRDIPAVIIQGAWALGQQRVVARAPSLTRSHTNPPAPPSPRPLRRRYDMVCPMRSAWDLHRAWPEAKLTIVPDSGHSAFDTGIQKCLLDATDAFRV